MIKLYPNDEWEEETIVIENGEKCLKSKISTTMSIVLPRHLWDDQEELEDICQAFSECLSPGKRSFIVEEVDKKRIKRKLQRKAAGKKNNYLIALFFFPAFI